ncbi:MAG: chorismate mutase, partial [Oscillospiraceae bacterium]|nr:chorismate mutase [Oscillospiraceae bacterium]
MDLNKLREQIDSIDTELVQLFNKRMAAAANVADFKTKNALPIYDSERERELLSRISSLAEEQNQPAVMALYNLIMELSRVHQQRIMQPTSPLVEQVQTAMENTPQLFPEQALVAF